ncbi:MAG: hypothetical protein ND866_23565 [Pyrinomonadaceae bacterium]|nr:hypothetical protein [Pyrinomonadaceae bacterium]
MPFVIRHVRERWELKHAVPIVTGHRECTDATVRDLGGMMLEMVVMIHPLLRRGNFSSIAVGSPFKSDVEGAARNKKFRLYN